ncbi:hypothetical protein AWB76_04847 [Caballeronia temeraria]|uniref:Uncharacterized protein n=1 Tax=Caballeronia temeraria TaxID=1777137 RepID=A0A158BYH1_9BURK|nr:hypothetical protein [Caballeronia temeraria]SAK75051.1 hypothetical protein AWB76_04847 [Caballeronia temeraria]
MTISSSVARICQLLETAGYKRLPSPLTIGGLSFDIPAAFVGAIPSPDLVLIADTGSESSQHILHNVEGVGRMLDVMKSRRPVTTVLAGVRPDSETFDAFARVCRVLTVGTLPDGDCEPTLRNWLAVLLPLNVPEPNQDLANPLNEITNHLDGLAPSISELVKTAAAGPDTVQSQLHAILNNTLANDEGSDDPA